MNETEQIEEGASTERGVFSGKMGFILAAAASAVGLGNIWRFPYLAAKYGGGAFLIIYLVLVVTFGFALMIAESALGRRTQQSAIGAFRHYGKKYAFIGVIAAAVPFILVSFYVVVGGWVTKFMVAYATAPAAEIASEGYFASFITSGGIDTFLWMYLFIVISLVVVALGVKKGIEKTNRFLMPTLIAMSIAIAVFGCCQPGALDGLAYYFVPDFSKFSFEMVVAAMGQMFFSLSLACGTMITYGSYLKRSENLEHSVRRIELFDTGIALLAGLMVIPACFAVMGNGAEVAGNAGPSLMFMVLPNLFAQFGGFSNMLGFLFFLLVLFAAFTSCISMIETNVSVVVDGLKCSRRKAVVINAVFVFAAATLCNLGYNALIGVDPMNALFGIGAPGDHQILDFLDFLSNTIMMPLVALLTCIFVGWIVKPGEVEAEVEQPGVTFRSRKLFRVMIRFIAPVFVVIILVGYILMTAGVLSL